MQTFNYVLNSLLFHKVLFYAELITLIEINETLSIMQKLNFSFLFIKVTVLLNDIKNDTKPLSSQF